MQGSHQDPPFIASTWNSQVRKNSGPYPKTQVYEPSCWVRVCWGLILVNMFASGFSLELRHCAAHAVDAPCSIHPKNYVSHGQDSLYMKPSSPLTRAIFHPLTRNSEGSRHGDSTCMLHQMRPRLPIVTQSPTSVGRPDVEKRHDRYVLQL